MYDVFIENSAVHAEDTRKIHASIRLEPMASPYGVSKNCPAAYDARYACGVERAKKTVPRIRARTERRQERGLVGVETTGGGEGEWGVGVGYHPVRNESTKRMNGDFRTLMEGPPNNKEESRSEGS